VYKPSDDLAEGRIAGVLGVGLSGDDVRWVCARVGDFGRPSGYYVVGGEEYLRLGPAYARFA
jgi:hypothetical protein